MINRLIILVLLISIAFLTACGGGGSSNETTEQGEVIIGLTDAEGDFITYAVGVKSLTLTQDNGKIVNTLPLAESAMVDFTQYTEMTEFFTAATIPVGKYVKATMVLDYTAADVQVEVGGEPVAAILQDGEGNPIEELALSVSLANHGALVVKPGVPAHLTLDFDLEASNQVDLSNPADPVVTVEPILIADLILEDPKEHRMRGLFLSADEEESFIKLAIRPFYKRNGNYGKLKAYVDEDTVYEVDGVAYSGDEGLAEVASLDRNTWLVVLGMLNMENRHFEATEVYAGSSVPGSELDVVRGVVTAREGDVLAVNAGAIVKSSGQLLFNVNMTLSLNDTTPVNRQLSNDSFTKDDISVGQRIAFGGTLVGDSTQGFTMDDAARVRMLLSQAAGNVVSTDAVNSELVLDVARMNARDIADYDFTGTGIDVANDADADNYQVNTSTLGLESYDALDPVRVRGFVTPFSSAPADFDAQTIISVVDVKAKMMMNWRPAEEAPFVNLTTEALVVSLNDISGPLHHVRRKGMHTDLFNLDNDPVLVPVLDKRAIYAIHQGGPVEIFSDFSEFSIALSERMEAGSLLRHISAEGYFADASSTLRAHKIRVVLHKSRN